MKLAAKQSSRSDVVQVRSVDVGEAEQVFATPVLAFAADPPNRWLYPAEDEYLGQFPTFVTALGGRALHQGTAFVSNDYSGASLWLAPGTSPDDEALAGLVRALAPDRSAEISNIIEEMGRYHPDEPHWYLPFIGVVPDRRGQGVGAALLRAGLAACDATGLPAYLESTNPRNRPLYERHGFEAIGEIRVCSCPPIVPMLRKAR
jgi:ribosomal protein S18 acetylase RimI-like enzyme